MNSWPTILLEAELEALPLIAAFRRSFGISVEPVNVLLKFSDLFERFEAIVSGRSRRKVLFESEQLASTMS